MPVICLPGLTRTSRDFHDLSCHLAQQRRVVTLDFRGRGRSAWARNAREYTPFTEMLDVLALIDAAAIGRATMIGTSRGGLVVMLIGVVRPAAIATVVLNDIGPHIEPAGLLRMAGYVNHTPKPESWDHAVAIVRHINEGSFAGLTDQDWAAFARRIFRDVDGRPQIDHDPRLAETLKPVSAAGGVVPDLWPQFISLRHVPLLVVRGENSDILSRETVAEMATYHTAMQVVPVKDRGHAPFLTEPGVPRAIEGLLELAD